MDSRYLSEAYSLASKLDQILGRARKDAQTKEQRAAINEAHAHRDRMMDALVEALADN